MAKRIIIQLKRAYDAREPGDGFRILVDRLWPRGVSKDFARIDLWFKEIAPSSALRKWFGHDPAKWVEFRKRYFKELDKNREAVEELLELVRHKPVTLVYGAKDQEHNHAVALKEHLLVNISKTTRSPRAAKKRKNESSANAPLAATRSGARADSAPRRG